MSQNDNYYCQCGHHKSNHKDFVPETIREFETTPIEKRKHSLEWYLSAMKTENMEYYCQISTCECGNYKIDNLRFLEDKYVQAQQPRE